MADDRVGHFLSATKDFGITDADTNFVRMINRWRLEKANPRAKLSPPRKQIVWYVEDTVPIEYRPYVEEGIREWNKAFEKIGFRDAIAVRWEEAGRDEFDPEDTNYCTFRWVTSDMGYALSCLRANPMTGEMIDGDVVFDAGFIRYWKQQYALLIASTKTADGRRANRPRWPSARSSARSSPPRWASASRPRQPAGDGRPRSDPNRLVPEVIPADQNFLAWELAKHRAGATGASASSSPACSATSPWPRSPWPTAPEPRRPQADAPTDRQGQGEGPKEPVRKPQPKDELPEEFLGQAIKSIVMHEVGPLAGPAAQLQGQHDAEGRPAPRHGDHPRQGAGRQRDGLLARSTSPPRARSRATIIRPPWARTTTGPSNTPTRSPTATRPPS